MRQCSNCTFAGLAIVYTNFVISDRHMHLPGQERKLDGSGPTQDLHRLAKPPNNAYTKGARRVTRRKSLGRIVGDLSILTANNRQL